MVRISPTEVAVADAEAFKAIHAVGSGFNKSPWYTQLDDKPSPGLFTMNDPKKHAQRRKLFARPFSKSELRRNWEGFIKTKAALAVNSMWREAQTNGKVDALKWWTFLATDVIGTLSFGEGFGMLELGEVSLFA